MSPAEAALAAAAVHHRRLVASVAARTGDLASAEDALGHAWEAAVRRWPVDGVPERPDAWLRAVALNAHRDRARHLAVARRNRLRVVDAVEDALSEQHPPGGPDPRLGLLFAAAHEALDPGVRMAFVAQVALGVDAPRLAGALLVSPDALTRRLTRARARLREVRATFEIPARAAWAPRLPAVRDALYAAFTLADHGPVAGHLRGEALALVRALAALLDDPESHGLHALFATVVARQPAAWPAPDRWVPLEDQDPRHWDADLLAEADAALRAAAAHGAPGRYPIEAAIQACHTARLRDGRPTRREVVALYDVLLTLHPTVGAATARAAALQHTAGPDATLAALDAISADAVAQHAPWWATRAHALDALGEGQAAQAAAAWSRAAALTVNPTVRAWLLGRARLSAPAQTGSRTR